MCLCSKMLLCVSSDQGNKTPGDDPDWIFPKCIKQKLTMNRFLN